MTRPGELEEKIYVLMSDYRTDLDNLKNKRTKGQAIDKKEAVEFISYSNTFFSLLKEYITKKLDQDEIYQDKRSEVEPIIALSGILDDVGGVVDYIYAQPDNASYFEEIKEVFLKKVDAEIRMDGYKKKHNIRDAKIKITYNVNPKDKTGYEFFGDKEIHA